MSHTEVRKKRIRSFRKKPDEIPVEIREEKEENFLAEAFKDLSRWNRKNRELRIKRRLDIQRQRIELRKKREQLK